MAFVIGVQLAITTPHGRRFRTGRAVENRLAPSIIDIHYFLSTSGSQGFEETRITHRLIARLVGNGADTAIPHAKITPLLVAGPNGVERAVVPDVPEMIDGRIGAIPVYPRTVELCVPARRRDAVLDATGRVPPSPLTVCGRRSFADHKGITRPVGDRRNVRRELRLQNRIIHYDPVVLRRRIGI